MTEIYTILKKLKQNSSNKYWNISWNLCMFLSNLVEIKKPKEILELGTSNGFSTLCLLKNLEKESKIITVEINEERFLEAKKNFKKFKQIKQIKGNFMELIENDKISGRYDLIFIDAQQQEYLKLFQLILNKKLIVRKGIIIFDNILTHKKSQILIDYLINNNYKYKTVEIDSGFLVIKF